MYAKEAEIPGAKITKELLSLLDDESFRVINHHGLVETEDYKVLVNCLKECFDPAGNEIEYFMKNKSEVFNKFKELELCTTNKCSFSIGTLRSDNGGEYLSKKLMSYLQQKGIYYELTA